VEWNATSSVTHGAKGATIVLRRIEPSFFVIENGKLTKQWGADLFKWAHGVRVERIGSLWATEAQDYHVLYKFDQNGKVVMMLGTKGSPGEGPNQFNRPTDMVVGPNGDIFVSDGYANSRVVKFSKDGRFIKTWGTKGTGPGQFDLPHSIVMDSRNRVLVGDRENARVQVFDQDGTFIEMWSGLNKPYGMAIGKDDTLYVGDADAGKITIAKGGKVIDVIENLGRPHWVSLAQPKESN
jgi:sugar lactone lactonase YvrE